jgi:hypothetical protein
MNHFCLFIKNLWRARIGRKEEKNKNSFLQGYEYSFFVRTYLKVIFGLLILHRVYIKSYQLYGK